MNLSYGDTVRLNAPLQLYMDRKPFSELPAFTEGIVAGRADDKPDMYVVWFGSYEVWVPVDQLEVRKRIL